MIRNYIKIAFRGFWKHKLFTLINIIGLSIGISAALVIYLIVNFDLTFDKFHKDNDRVYRVVTDFVYSGEPFYNSGVTGPLPEAVKNEVSGVQQSAPFWMPCSITQATMAGFCASSTASNAAWVDDLAGVDRLPRGAGWAVKLRIRLPGASEHGSRIGAEDFEQ